MPRKRTKKSKTSIYSRRKQTPQKTANKRLKTQATQQSTQAKRKTSRKRAQSVPKTDGNGTNAQNHAVKQFL